MEAQRPTLPLLLDLNASPSYPNSRPLTGLNRPPTSSSSYKPFGTTSQGFSKHLKKNSEGEPQKTFETANTCRKPPHSTPKDPQVFCFTEFRSIQKPLPKLYTSAQYEAYQQKVNNMKERFQRLYKDAEDEQKESLGELKLEKLKDLYLGAEKMFNESYSVKYFGLKDDQLGIISKRFPMNMHSAKGSNEIPQDFKKGFSVERKSADHEGRNNAKQQKKARNLSANYAEKTKFPIGSWKDANELATIKKSENILTEEDLLTGAKEESSERYRIASKKINKSSNPNVEQTHNDGQDMLKFAIKNSQYNKVAYSSYPGGVDGFGRSVTMSTENNLERVQENANLQEGKDIVIGEAENINNWHEVQNRHLSQEDQEINQNRATQNLETSMNLNEYGKYIVTQYFMPKKLQVVKKSVEIGQNAHKTLGSFRIQGNDSSKPYENISKKTKEKSDLFGSSQTPSDKNKIWTKVVVANQAASNSADFERNLMSLGKVKRNILRSVHVEKAWEAKVYKDELDVPEKFRTHEVRKVMANEAKYSYAKLLETMHTSKRPEIELVSNTEKMERILALREEKKKVIEQKIAKGNTIKTEDKRDHNGNYVVKVWYPKENEMFNRFAKIRANADYQTE